MIINGLELVPIKKITTPKGAVLHALKSSEKSFSTFGEAYFSCVDYGKIKGWKRHHRMVQNLVVPQGQIHFVVYDNRPDSVTRGKIFEIDLSRENYQRLTVPPMLWVAFQGRYQGESILLNLASIEHDPGEADNLELETDQIPYQWEKL